MLDELRRALRMESPSPRASDQSSKKGQSRGLRKKRLSSAFSLETQSVQDDQLGCRSISLSTLLSSGSKPHSEIRSDKLQTLEAKMASIEMSLGWKSRREALLETLPRAARDLVKELDTLHQTVKDKDEHIRRLESRVENNGGVVGSVTSTAGTGVNGGIYGTVTVNSAGLEPRKEATMDRLQKVTNEINAKKIAIKNLKLALEQINVTENIDVRIRAAEIECELEKEELNLLTLKQEAATFSNTALRDSNTALRDSNRLCPQINDCATSEGFKMRPSLQQVLSIPGASNVFSNVTLISARICYNFDNPPFHITHRPPHGCVIDWATDDTTLKKGDSIVELNGEIVLGKSLDHIRSGMTPDQSTLTMVVARQTTNCLENQVEEKYRENRSLVSRLDKALKERDELSKDNTRLRHRISYLEDQVKEMREEASGIPLGLGTPPRERGGVKATVPGATVIQVFQRGPHTLAVSETDIDKSETHIQDYPTLPRLKSPSCSSQDSGHTMSASTKGLCDSDKPILFSNANSPQSRNTSILSSNGASGHLTSTERIVSINKVRLDEETGTESVYSDAQDEPKERLQQQEEYDYIDRLRDTISEKFPSYSYKKPATSDSASTASFPNSYASSRKAEKPSGYEERNRSVDDRMADAQNKENIYERSTLSSAISQKAESERGRKVRPIPPKKPERLSLQRTISMQSVNDPRPCSRASSSSTPSKGTAYKPANYVLSENILQSDENYDNHRRTPNFIKPSNNCSTKNINNIKESNYSYQHLPIINGNNFSNQNSKSTCSQIFRDSRRLTVSSVDYMPSYNKVCSKLNYFNTQPKSYSNSHIQPQYADRNDYRATSEKERFQALNMPRQFESAPHLNVRMSNGYVDPRANLPTLDDSKYSGMNRQIPANPNACKGVFVQKKWRL